MGYGDGFQDQEVSGPLPGTRTGPGAARACRPALQALACAPSCPLPGLWGRRRVQRPARGQHRAAGERAAAAPGRPASHHHPLHDQVRAGPGAGHQGTANQVGCRVQGRGGRGVHARSRPALPRPGVLMAAAGAAAAARLPPLTPCGCCCRACSMNAPVMVALDGETDPLEVRARAGCPLCAVLERQGARRQPPAHTPPRCRSP